MLLCRRICAPPELNIRIFFNPLKNTIIRTYSPKGYTSVTVGDTPTACARQTMSTRSGAILEQITDIIAKQGSDIITRVAPLQVLALLELLIRG